MASGSLTLATFSGLRNPTKPNSSCPSETTSFSGIFSPKFSIVEGESLLIIKQDAAHEPECIHAGRSRNLNSLVMSCDFFPLLPYQCAVDCRLRNVEEGWSAKCRVKRVECGVYVVYEMYGV